MLVVQVVPSQFNDDDCYFLKMIFLHQEFLRTFLMNNFCAVVNSSNYRLVSWDLMEENTIITFSIIEIFNSQINFIK